MKPKLLSVLSALSVALVMHAPALGGTLTQDSNPSDIRDFIERAQKEKNPTPYQLCSLGTAHLWMSNNKQAIDAATRALKADPKYAEAYNLRGKAYRASKEFRLALKDFDKAIELGLNRSGVLTNRAFVRMKLNDAKGAMSDLEKDLATNEKSAVYWATRGETEYKLGRMEASLQSLNKAVKLDKKDSVARHLRGIVYSKLGNKKLANADFQKALELGYH